jgi:hypothetical protein
LVVVELLSTEQLINLACVGFRILKDRRDNAALIESGDRGVMPFA